MSKIKALALNIDANIIYGFANMMGNKNYEKTPKIIERYISCFLNHGITDMMFNVNLQSVSMTPSKIFTFVGDKYYQKVENGIEVDYTNNPFVLAHKDIFAAGVDPYKIMLQEVTRKGINGWISVRMNDLHGFGEETSVLRGDLYYKAFNNKWMLNIEEIPYYWRWCVDYGVDYVRNKYLDYVKEQVDKYDCYGIELDFMREIFCFDYIRNKERNKIMTDFMRNIREYLNTKEKKVGHKIKVAIRLLRDIDENVELGFDVKTFVKTNLVDVFVLTPRWGTNDDNMPFQRWKELVKGTDIEIWAGQEEASNLELTDNPEYMNLFGYCVMNQTYETAKGLAYSNLCNGADGTYLYNSFPNCEYKQSVESLYDSFKKNTYYIKTWESLRSESEMVSGVRRHIIGVQDICPVGFKQYKQLPINICGKGQIEIQTGQIDTIDKVILWLGYKVMPDLRDVCIIVDGQEAKKKENIDDKSFYTQSIEKVVDNNKKSLMEKWTNLVAYEIQGCSSKTNRIIEVLCSNPISVNYAEIVVIRE